MRSASKPWWQQATAVVGIGASGAITSFSFMHGAAQAADRPSPAHIRLLALQQVAKPAKNTDALLRSAIVNVAQYYLRLAAGKTPAEMEALIWQHDSLDGVDHGPSCAAFASLTLELGSEAIGQQSWVTGGSSYPWPLHDWADVRVDPNPASPAVVSVLQAAQAHDRWHPLGDRYRPKPGDWVLFNGHVEVVTSYAGGVLHTIGGDSLPNLSVNAHEYANPLSAQGVAGFVNNGEIHTRAARQPRGAGQAGRSNQAASRPGGAGRQGGHKAGATRTAAVAGAAAIPGTSTPTQAPVAAGAESRVSSRSGGPRPAGGSGGSAASGGSAGSGTSAASGRSGGSGRSGTSREATGSGRATGTADPAQAPPSGQWHAVHPRTSHRPARPMHKHPPGAKLAGPRAPAASKAGGSSGGAMAGAANASVPGAAPGAVTLGSPAPFQKASNGGTVIPGLPVMTHHHAGGQADAGSHNAPQPQAQAQSARAQMTPAQRAFIAQIASGAVQAQHRYGVPASVTIAQAIDESGWGQSILASKDHNLFGMKGEGPAGTDTQLTQEYENGQWVVTAAPFRAYQNMAQSIDDHGRLLATSDYYRQVMAAKHNPDAFASALTGVYATDPNYGQTLIGLMRQFNLYQYNHAAPPAQHQRAAAKPARGKPGPAQRAPAAPRGQASVPGVPQPSPDGPAGGRGPGSSPGRGPRPGVSSPPRTSRPAPSSPPGTTHPAPSSPPRTTRPAPSSPPNTGRPTPSSPPGTGRPTPSSPPSTGRPVPSSPPNSAPRSSSPGRTTRPTSGSPVGGGQPGPAPSPRASQSTRPAMQNGSPSTGSPGRSPKATPVKATLVADWTPTGGGTELDASAVPLPASRPATVTRASVSTSSSRMAAPARAEAAPAEASATDEAPAAELSAAATPAEETAEWSLADWVPNWASEATESAAKDSAATKNGQAHTSHATTGLANTSRSGTGRPRLAAGLLDRLAGGRAAKAAAASATPDGRYERPLPRAVRNAFAAMAKGPLLGAEPLYRDVAGHIGLPWELLAACDWMQCEAKPKHSPVHGEKLGTDNTDGTVYWTKSAALEQCAEDLVELARKVYGLELTRPEPFSVPDLANAFAAFRWGGLLKLHHTSAMEFPYSVAGLTVQHIGMRWPAINADAPDKPGSRFRMHFGAVPVLLSLGYPALA